MRKRDQKVPNIFIVQAAPLLQYIETNKSLKICVHVCVFFPICESQKMQKVWIAWSFAVGHCTASHCIGLYKEITLKSPFALIYRDGVGGKIDAGR